MLAWLAELKEYCIAVLLYASFGGTIGTWLERWRQKWAFMLITGADWSNSREFQEYGLHINTHNASIGGDESSVKWNKNVLLAVKSEEHLQNVLQLFWIANASPESELKEASGMWNILLYPSLYNVSPRHIA